MKPTRADIVFKLVDQTWELEEISALNYRTFVEEIPQHAPNDGRVLCDSFHSQNTYIIAVRDRQLLGMVAVRDQRPFSLDRKLSDLDSYLPAHHHACEVRLLATEPKHRHTRLAYGLLAMLVRYCKIRGYDLAVISGTLRQLRLYEHLGFQAFGPRVGTSEALYQPMYITPARLRLQIDPKC